MTGRVNADGTRMQELLREHEDRLLTRWTEIAGAAMRGRTTHADLRQELREIYSLVARGAEEDTTELRAVLAELSRSRARQGFTPAETATTVYGLKEAVYEVVEADGDPETLRDFIAFSRRIDALGLFTFETYAATREKIISDQAEQLLELSTPVVKLWEGILAVPLVGTLDSARTQVVMEKLLQTLVDTGSEHAVIDITGVSAVDTEVAQHLLKTVMAARLMGAECVISGIRPQIAHTIVTLGIEFGDITTKATLADALAYALRRSGTELVRTQRARSAGTEGS